MPEREVANEGEKSDYAATIRTFTLQRHQAYLTRVTVSSYLNRFLCFAMSIAMLALPYSHIAAFGCLGVGFFIVLYWHFEQRLLRFRLYALERQLAAQIGGVLEDVEIRFRYEREYEFRRLNTFQIYLRYEPIFWMMAMMILSTFSIIYHGRLMPPR
jgi:hypothetical protein